jgi:Tfp pilus assembly protein FimT
MATTWRTGRGGYTFVELAITVLIVGILTALVMPKFVSALCYYRASGAAKRIAADVALAQRTAMRTCTSQTVRFSPSGTGNNTYTVSGQTDMDFSNKSYTVTLSADPYQALLISANFGGSTTLSFDRYGVPTSAGSVVVQAGSYQKTVNVASQTGITSIP